MHKNFPASKWLVRSKVRERPRLRLFCFHHAGGGALTYRRWHELVPESIEVVAVRLPGRETMLSSPRFTRLAPLVATLVQEIEPALDVPFAFFGNSLGAVVAFELMRQLELRAHRGHHLLVAAHRAPHLPLRHQAMHTLGDQELVERLVQLGGTPPELLESQELKDMMAPILRSDARICETYVAGVEDAVSCPITAFAGDRDAEVSEHDLDAWRRHTTAAFSKSVLPGGHFVVLSQMTQVVPGIARVLGF